MALVYKATNIENGKTYIGMTRKTLAQRIYMHHWHAKKDAKRGRLFMVFSLAIRKYGPEAFVFETLADDLSINDALQKERELIAELKPEYNVAAGGVGPQGVKWSESRRKHMAIALKAAWTDERRAKNEEFWLNKRGPKPTRKVLNPRKGHPRPKPVQCLNNGLWFASAKDAGASCGASVKEISKVCRGEALSANGHFFVYAETSLSKDDLAAAYDLAKAKHRDGVEGKRTSRMRPVVCLNDGQVYESGAAAARSYGIKSAMTVVQCCGGGTTTKSGLRFMYADASQPPPDKRAKSTAEAQRIRLCVLEGLKRAHKKNKKRVLCIDDGLQFESISDAASHYNKHISLVSAAIYRNGRAGGKRFVFVGDL